MIVQPVAQYLTRFDTETSEGPALPDFSAGEDLAPLWAAEPVEDWETRVAAAHDAGYAEGQAAAQAEAAAEIERLQQEHAERLAEERQKWLHDEGETLKAGLAAAMQQVQETVAESVGQVLRPFVIESLRRQMLDELATHIASMAASHDEIAIKIRGAADLLAALQEKLGPLLVAIDYEEGEGVDLTVIAGQTMIETRLQAWIDLISANAEQ